MNSYHLLRAEQLYQQGRYTDAEKEARMQLAQEPQDAAAMALIAQCMLAEDRYDDALDMAERARAMMPAEPSLNYLVAVGQYFKRQPREALATLDQVQQLEPTYSPQYHLRGNIAMAREDWQTALESAERGLQFEPDNVELVNLRARALIQLNRQDEAAQTLDFALNRNPESSQSHANKGWVAIERGDSDAAVHHFRDALRFDPNSEYARHGLKEAIKSKNVLYRGVLRYFLWMGKMTQQYRWGFIIGLYILYRSTLWAADRYPVLQPVLYPLIALYILFAFSSWVAVPVSNLFLQFHPMGKHALTKDEKLASGIVAASLVLAVGFFGWFALGGGYLAAILAGYFTLMLIPLGGAFSVPAETTARRNLVLLAVAIAVVGALAIALPGNMTLFYLFIGGVFFYSWGANYLIARA